VSFEYFRRRAMRHYLAAVREFALEEWPADRLGGSMRCRKSIRSTRAATGRSGFMWGRPAPTGAAARRDPRVAADAVPPAVMLRPPDPLIVGLYDGFRVLVDGYFRAILFLRSARPGERIAVLAPAVPEAGIEPPP
jgi:hypothetical protein